PYRPRLPLRLVVRAPRSAALFPYTTLFRSRRPARGGGAAAARRRRRRRSARRRHGGGRGRGPRARLGAPAAGGCVGRGRDRPRRDRKSTRLNSSHVSISYAVFCLKKKTCPT